MLLITSREMSHIQDICMVKAHEFVQLDFGLAEGSGGGAVVKSGELNQVQHTHLPSLVYCTILLAIPG